MQKLIFIVIVLLIAVACIYTASFFLVSFPKLDFGPLSVTLNRDRVKSETPSTAINTFKDCVEAGNPMTQTFPRQCSANGKTFTEGARENTGNASTGSGVNGVVTIGPTCPVMRTPPDPNCADKAYKATINIKDLAGKLVTQVRSGEDGKFSVSLPPGNYVLEPVRTGVLPRGNSVQVVVPNDKYVSVHIEFDSGIR